MDHLAIDIGASSGRIVHGKLENNILITNEIHRFTNQFSLINNQALWDVDYLVEEMLIGLQKAKKQGITTCTIGIDTWAVDYVLLDAEDKLLHPAFSYRDERTANTFTKVFELLPREQIYEKTGIQFMPINTLYQLYEDPFRLKAETILLIPDYLNFVLTGVKAGEITNASTTQLLNLKTRDYDEDLLHLLGLKREQFPPLIEAGSILGPLQTKKFPIFDLPEATVIAVASHDTASAVVGTPATTDNCAYLSSGTWSLVGVENKSPINSFQSLQENYTNEYGAFSTYRYLKNVMGLWVIQEVQRLLPKKYSFTQLVQLAKAVPSHRQFIDFNDNRFLNPKNMITEMQLYCQETNQAIPQTAGEIAAAVYYNLAILIAIHLDQIEAIIHRPIEHLHIVGGGAHNDFLNQCIANYSQRTVYAGPTEATAIGNLILQLIAMKKCSSIDSARLLIHHSFNIKQFSPIPFDKHQLFNKFSTKVHLST